MREWLTMQASMHRPARIKKHKIIVHGALCTTCTFDCLRINIEARTHTHTHNRLSWERKANDLTEKLNAQAPSCLLCRSIN